MEVLSVWIYTVENINRSKLQKKTRISSRITGFLLYLFCKLATDASSPLSQQIKLSSLDYHIRTDRVKRAIQKLTWIFLVSDSRI